VLALMLCEQRERRFGVARDRASRCKSATSELRSPGLADALDPTRAGSIRLARVRAGDGAGGVVSSSCGASAAGASARSVGAGAGASTGAARGAWGALGSPGARSSIRYAEMPPSARISATPIAHCGSVKPHGRAAEACVPVLVLLAASAAGALSSANTRAVSAPIRASDGAPCAWA